MERGRSVANRLVAWVSTLALVLGLMPLPAYAESPSYAAGTSSVLGQEPGASVNGPVEGDDVLLDVTYGQTEARSMLDMVNGFRTGGDAWAWAEGRASKVEYQDLSPLAYDYGLERVAMQRAAELAIRFAHERPDGTSALAMVSGTSGENIAAGQASAEEAFVSWREDNEPYAGQGHRRNMLSGSFTAVGIGHVVCNGTHYWVQEFSVPALDATETDANDSAATVGVDVDPSLLTVAQVEDLEPVALEVGGDPAALPAVHAQVATSDFWARGGKSSVRVELPGIAWASSDEGVAKVEGGQVLPVAEGQATLTAVNPLDAGAPLSVSVTVAKASSTVKLAAQTKTYTGKALAYSGTVTKTGSTGKVTYEYYSDSACTKAVAAANVVNAGTYYVKATVAADSNYEAATSAAAKFTIAKASSTIKLAAQTKTYTGKALAYSGGVTKTGSTGKVSYKYYSDSGCTKEVAAANVKAAGTYYVKATVAADANYKAATSAAAKFTIAKASSTIKLATQSKTYTGKALVYSGTVTKTGSTGKVTYAYYSDSACTKAVKAADVKAAKVYYVKGTVAADANHKAATSAAAKFTVNKASSSVKLAAQTKTYTGKALAYSGGVTKTGSAGKVTYKYYSDAKCTKAVSAAKVVNAGTYYVKGTVAADANHKAATSAAAKFVIAKASSSVKLAAQTKTYTGKALAYSGKVTKTGSAGKVTYKYYSDAKCTKEVKAANVKAAKVYYVKGTVAADANHKAATSAAAKFTVSKAANPISVKGKNVSSSYSATANRMIGASSYCTVSGQQGKLTYKKSSGNASITVGADGKMTVKKGLKAGSYPVKVAVTAAGNANYQSATKTISTTVTVTKPSVGSSQTVYVTKSGDKYHRDGCRYLSKSKIPTTLAEAIADGKEPCSVCW